MTHSGQAIRYLSLDPGERVGWARVEVRDGEYLNLRHGVTPIKPMAMKLVEEYPHYDVVIMEEWRLYPHLMRQQVGSRMWSSQFVGMVQLCAWQNPAVEFVIQPATFKKPGFANLPPEVKERLKESSEQHDQDALAHLFYYLWRNKCLNLYS